MPLWHAFLYGFLTVVLDSDRLILMGFGSSLKLLGRAKITWFLEARTHHL